MLRDGTSWSLLLASWDEKADECKYDVLFKRETIDEPKGFFLLATVMARIRAYGQEYFKKVRKTQVKAKNKDRDVRRKDKDDEDEDDEDDDDDNDNDNDEKGKEREREVEEEKQPTGGSKNQRNVPSSSSSSSSTQQDSLPLGSLAQEYSAFERLLVVRHHAMHCV